MFFMTVYLSEAKSQTTKISFETSESFTLGGVNGQNGWQVWSDNNSYPVGSATIINTMASDGANSVKLVNVSGSFDHMSGIKKNVSALTTGDDYEVSFDHMVEATNTTGYAMSIFSTGSIDYSDLSNTTASFFLLNGVIPVYFEADGTAGFGANLSIGTWHTFKVVVKKSTSILQYYIDGNLLYSGALGANKNIHTLDFSFDNHGQGFLVDNVRITDLSPNLAVGEQTFANNDISVFPNPTADVVNIKTASGISSVGILDLKGGLVRNYNDGKSQINISDLPKGVYLIKVKTKTTEFTKKIIKN